MTVKTVLRIGDPLLNQISEPVVDPTADVIQRLVNDMFDTMHAYQGAGLAAPQIGVMLRVVIFGVEHNERYPDAPMVPETVLINPQIEVLDDTQASDWEGCLSVPGLRGRVTRPDHIRYRGVDQHGNPIDREVNGFHARVVQHEVDHLDGILYVKRISDLSDFGFTEELQAANRYDSPPPCDSECQ